MYIKKLIAPVLDIPRPLQLRLHFRPRLVGSSQAGIGIVAKLTLTPITEQNLAPSIHHYDDQQQRQAMETPSHQTVRHQPLATIVRQEP